MYVVFKRKDWKYHYHSIHQKHINSQLFNFQRDTSNFQSQIYSRINYLNIIIKTIEWTCFYHLFLSFSILSFWFWLKKMSFYKIKIFNHNSLWKARFERCWYKIDSFGFNFIHLFKTNINHQKESKIEIQTIWIEEFLDFQ